MSSALALLLLSVAAPPARAQTQASCRADLESYQAQPTVARLEPVLPCLDLPDETLRADVMSGILTRQIWDDPRFMPEIYPRLRPVAAAAQRNMKDQTLWSAGFHLDLWLDNAQRYADERARQSQARTVQAQDQLDGVRDRLSLAFGAGIVLQTLLFVFASDAENPLGRVGIAAAAGLLGLTPGKHERSYALHFHIAYCFVIYAFVVFAQFKKEILARVSESNLLVNSLTLWYLGATFLGRGHSWDAFAALAALPTLGTLVIAFTIREWSFPVRLSCYVWFLVLTLAISTFQLRFGDLAFLFFSRPRLPDPFNVFLTGMVAAYLGASLFYLYILIPIAGKNQTQAARMIQWREDAHLMASRFADYRMTAAEALQIVAVQGGLYALNYREGWLSPVTIMNLSMIGLPLLFQLWFRFRERLSAGAPAQERNRLTEPA